MTPPVEQVVFLDIGESLGRPRLEFMPAPGIDVRVEGIDADPFVPSIPLTGLVFLRPLDINN